MADIYFIDWHFASGMQLIRKFLRCKKRGPQKGGLQLLQSIFEIQNLIWILQYLIALDWNLKLQRSNLSSNRHPCLEDSTPLWFRLGCFKFLNVLQFQVGFTDWRETEITFILFYSFYFVYWHIFFIDTTFLLKRHFNYWHGSYLTRYFP